MTRIFAVLAIILIPTLAIAGEDDAKKKEKKKGFRPARLVGEWTYSSGKRAGADVDQQRLQGKVTITKETITLPAGPDQVFVMEYKLDAETKPISIDISIKSGPVPEGNTQGIIKVAGNKLTLCYDPFGGQRPKEFKSTEDNGAFMFELTRVKKNDGKKGKKKDKKKE